MLNLMLMACGTADVDGVNPSSIEADTTWHEHARPIVEQHCVRCHQEGGLGVGDFTDESVVVAFSDAMLSAVQSGIMPPPASDPDCQDYIGADNLTLSAEEEAVLAAWVEQGSALGNPDDYPGVVIPETELLDADLTVSIETPYTPTYSDTANPGNEYRCFALESGREDSFYLTAMAPLVDQPSIVHHIVLFTMPRDEVDEQLRSPEGKDCINGSGGAELSGMLAAWAPGMLPIELPDDMGIYVSSSDMIVLQMHYYAGADAAGLSDQSGYAFRTASSVDRQVYVAPLGIFDFAIPANEESYSDSATLTNTYFNMDILGVFPHMHVLGSHYAASVQHSDGSESCLVEGDYDFSNQMTYQFTEPVPFDINDKVNYTCTWDNSADNPDQINDSPQTTYYGERTDEEMCFFFSLLAL